MKWIKQGLIFRPDKNKSWMYSHAALPTSLEQTNGKYKIFFSSRDKNNRAHIGSFDLNLNDQCKITNVSKDPLICPGEWGFFDDHGVQACSTIRNDNGDIYLYYLGWNPSKKEPLFHTSMGLAISKDGGLTFKKHSNAPILQRSSYDPWMVSGGTVIKKENKWLMYYLSGFKFEFNGSKPTSWYNIKIAYSEDGINWNRDGDIALDLEDKETNISRLTIDYFQGTYRAWFPVKRVDRGYRCGYAESKDGIKWERDDKLGLPISESGWDSEAIDKMEVIRRDSRLYMLYNGNKFGYDGIGLAYTDL